MRYKKLGNTGLKVSELCLGTMTFSGEGGFDHIGNLNQEEATGLVRQAIEAGINCMDTANMYSAGHSEEMLGKALIQLGINRDSVVLATKVRGRMGKGPNDVGLSRKHIL